MAPAITIAALFTQPERPAMESLVEAPEVEEVAQRRVPQHPFPITEIRKALQTLFPLGSAEEGHEKAELGHNG
eukprot:5220156-Alexandrium_andersonii.AAC.1